MSTADSGEDNAGLNMTRRREWNWVVCAAVVVALWAILYALRPGHELNGQISSTVYLTYPWQIGQRFALGVRTATGRLIFFRGLQGRCDGVRMLYGDCRKPELPVGSSVHMIVYGFADPNLCASPSDVKTMDLNCLSNLNYISSMVVEGRQVDAGWGNSPSIMALYLLIAVGAGILAINEWRISRISNYTLFIFVFAAGACILNGDTYF